MTYHSSVIRRVTIEKLAPTGEGIARGPEGVGFIAGALPGETVEAEVDQVRSKFWRGRAARVLSESPDRRGGPHAGCSGCDWAHFDPSAARQAKRDLFLETMERIGRLPPEGFNELTVAPSPAGYRLRNRFHVSGAGQDVQLGYFVPRTHRVSPAETCEAVTETTRDSLARLRDSLASSRIATAEIATLETLDAARRLVRLTVGEAAAEELSRLADALAPLFDGVRLERSDGVALIERGEPRLWLRVLDREFPVTTAVFFQSNRFLAETLYRDVRGEAQEVPPGLALDAFAGVGFFAGALLDAGHRVNSVEGSPPAVREAESALQRWKTADTWRIHGSSVHAALNDSPDRFALAVVDPPRGGLGIPLARALGAAVSRRILYVSCEPSTLARDLLALLQSGFRIRRSRLYDLFAFTHRIEAVVTLDRESGR